MATYAYTASSATPASSANIQTDKIRIVTSNAAIQYTTSYPNVAGTGNITCLTTSPNVSGANTTFTSQLASGYWIGNATGTTVGVVSYISNNGNLVLTANANVAIAGAGYTISPYGVPFTTANANSQLVPPNTVLNSVIVGQGNIVSYISANGANTLFTITELGMPHAPTGTSGYPNGM